ncbi:MAG: hypothetical protein CL780_01075 [Chloroflexi bacterium]|nr:hypothetical protein [Chloroflexota bacterium]|tara:strand:+ start:612 stop:1067 length:456 start_codon:yes stop_codon:yes gene_type:complete
MTEILYSITSNKESLFLTQDYLKFSSKSKDISIPLEAIISIESKKITGKKKSIILSILGIFSTFIVVQSIGNKFIAYLLSLLVLLASTILLVDYFLEYKNKYIFFFTRNPKVFIKFKAKDIQQIDQIIEKFQIPKKNSLLENSPVPFRNKY